MSTDATDTVLLEIDGPIATVTFNRPDRLNAWSWEMGMALTERMEAIAANREVRAVVLCGSGRSFCAGIDLKPDVRDRIVGRSPAEKVLNYYHRYRGSHRRTQGIEAIPQPIVVAIHGHCLGAGFEIAMLGDIRLAAEGTVFGCPEVKIGVAIDCGLDLRLAQEVGPSWAKWMALTARRFDATLAHRLGLVRRCIRPTRSSRRRTSSPPRSPGTHPSPSRRRSGPSISSPTAVSTRRCGSRR